MNKTALNIDKSIEIGSTVVVKIDQMQPITIKIVANAVDNFTRNAVSHLSPIGKAILGKNIGDVTFYSVGDRTLQVKIIKFL